jgi:hypothetical protein
VEGGPLLPVKGELYQAAVGAAGLHGLANLARLLHKDDISRQLIKESEELERLINRVFWLAEKKRYAFAIDQADKPVDEPSVLAAVPMWFHLLLEDQAQPMINELAAPEHQADWGMRIVSTQTKLYSGGGYHFGSVWPLFTGWASVGEYEYHRALPAYTNLRANALLALDGSLGHVTEVLSGDEYQPLSTSSPHQIWSAAMVVSPLLRGLLGLSRDAEANLLNFAPHVPSDWNDFAVKNIRLGSCTLDLHYTHKDEGIVLVADRSGAGDCVLEFSPAISPIAEVLAVESNGHRVAHNISKSASDQHVNMRWPLSPGSNRLSISLRNDFGLSWPTELPPLGSKSLGMREISETWSAPKDRLEIEFAGIAGSVYELEVRNAGRLMRVEGAEWIRAESNRGRIRISMPATNTKAYAHTNVVFHFASK